jgi:hypothetical protein
MGDRGSLECMSMRGGDAERLLFCTGIHKCLELCAKFNRLASPNRKQMKDFATESYLYHSNDFAMIDDDSCDFRLLACRWHIHVLYGTVGLD